MTLGLALGFKSTDGWQLTLLFKPQKLLKLNSHHIITNTDELPFFCCSNMLLNWLWV